MSGRSKINYRKICKGKIARVREPRSAGRLLPNLGSKAARHPVDESSLAEEIERLRVVGADCRRGTTKLPPIRRRDSSE